MLPTPSVRFRRLTEEVLIQSCASSGDKRAGGLPRGVAGHVGGEGWREPPLEVENFGLNSERFVAAKCKFSAKGDKTDRDRERHELRASHGHLFGIAPGRFQPSHIPVTRLLALGDLFIGQRNEAVPMRPDQFLGGGNRPGRGDPRCGGRA